MADGAGDWPCPNVSCVNNTKLVFGSKSQCPKCGAAKGGLPPVNDNIYSMGNSFQNQEEYTPSKKGMQGGDSPDDWQCPNTNCINHTKMVFGKRASCPSCGTARNAKQPGDWQCPNQNCVNHTNTVFASKSQCPKCGAPRMGAMNSMASYASQIYQMVQPAMGGGKGNGYFDALAGGGGGKGNGYFNALAGGGGGGPSSNPGDWPCPNASCLNSRKLVFAKHATCPKCGSNKMPVPAFGGKGGGRANPGDWQCPNADCVNHRNKVFAKHTSCPQCGQEKLGDFGDFGARPDRSRSPYRMLSA